MKPVRDKLSYANVVSTLCLLLLLGSGAAYAASHLSKNSVGAKQLKKNSVTASKIKKGAVVRSKLASGSVGNAQLQDDSITGANVKDGSLTGADLAPGTIPTPTPRTARLQSGETIIGFTTIEETASSGTQFFGASGSFPILPKNPIPVANMLVIAGGSGPNCPGIGQAAAGYLCVYGTDEADAKEPNLYPETGNKVGGATYGFQLQVESVTVGTVIYDAVWAYTEP